MRRLVSISAATLLLGACAGWGGSPAAEIRGVDWQAVDIAGRAPVGPTPVTLRLQRGRNLAGGESGCNIWSASYALARSTVSFSDVTSTRRACPEPQMRQETAYLSLLQEIDRYTVWADGSLTLSTPGGRTVTFRRLEGDPPAG